MNMFDFVRRHHPSSCN